MSDVGDVHRAHMRPDVPIEDRYIRAARAMLDPSSTMIDRLRFVSMHRAENVVLLGNLIDELRKENARLMDMLFDKDVDNSE